MKTGLVFHELYLWHHTGNHADYIPYGYPVEPLNHSESPDAKRRIKNLLEVSGLYEKLFKISPRKATKDEILYDMELCVRMKDTICRNSISS